MAKFPTYEEMAKNVAEKALDEFLYDGKSIREWMQIIASEDAVEIIKTLEQERNIGDEAYAKGWENGEIAERSRHKQELCEDAISRQVVIDSINEYFHDEYYQRTSIQDCRDCLIKDVIKNLPPVTPQYTNMKIQKMEQFAEWVATEIFDDNWEYNKDTFEELACRKLEKLGIVRANSDKWELVKPLPDEESEGYVWQI